MMITSYRLVDPARVLIQCLMVVQREHLCLLVILILLLLRGLVLIEAGLLLSFLLLPSVISRLVVFLIEESEVIWVLPFTVARIGVLGLIVIYCLRLRLLVVYLQVVGDLLLRLGAVCRRPLLITDALVALVADKYAVARVRVVVVGARHLAARILVVARPVILTDAVVVAEGRRRGRDAAEAGDVAASALEHLVRQHLGGQVLSLPDLRTVLQTVGLLGEEDVSVVVRGFYDFWPGSPVFHVDAETLIRFGALGTWMQSVMSDTYLTTVGLCGATNLMIEIIVVVLVRLRCAVSRPEATEPGRIHLFLK